MGHESDQGYGPIADALAREALRVAQDALPSHSHRFSPKTFTQQPLFAILVLRQSSETDYRGVVQRFHDFADLWQVWTMRVSMILT